MNLTPAWETLTRLGRDVLALAPNLAAGLAVFAVFFLAGRILRSSVRGLSDRYGRRRNLGLVLGRLAQAGVLLIGLLVGLLIIFPSFKMGDLIQLLGIGSVAIGFAFRDILQNFLAGILILLTEPFRIGDQIAYASYEGTVEDIHTRATTLRTYDGRRVVIPNAELFTNPLTVNTAYDTRRLEYDIGIGYGDDVEEAKRVILSALHKMEGVLPEPAPDVLLIDLAPSTVNLRVRWWITPPRRADALHLRDRVLSAIKRDLTGHGIELPFPTQQILLHAPAREDGDSSERGKGASGSANGQRAERASHEPAPDRRGPGGAERGQTPSTRSTRPHQDERADSR